MTEQSSSYPEPPDLDSGVPHGLLLSRDLIFTTKVTETARSLGFAMTTAGNSALVKAMIERGKPRVVFVDLAAGDLVVPARIVEYRAIAGDSVPFVAFGSHVDAGALAAARTAGCVEAMPRSRFSGELVDLIRRYFDNKI